SLPPTSSAYFSVPPSAVASATCSVCRKSRLSKGTSMGDSRLHQLSALGQSVWIDYLSRDLIHSGGLAQKMEEDAVTGVTSNPTIFQKAISQGNAYDDQMRDLLEQEPKEIFIALAGRDIGDACDLMRKVFDGGKGLRGWVSMEFVLNHASATE